MNIYDIDFDESAAGLQATEAEYFGENDVYDELDYLGEDLEGVEYDVFVVYPSCVGCGRPNRNVQWGPYGVCSPCQVRALQCMQDVLQD